MNEMVSNEGIWCSWYNEHGGLRCDKAYSNKQVDTMKRHCMDIGGSDFQTGINGTKRPKIKE